MLNDGPSPFAGTRPVASLGQAGAVTLVEGQTFCLSGRSGDIVPHLPHGLFVLDTRSLSRFELRVDGSPLEPLAVAIDEPFAATFVLRGAPDVGRADADVVCRRRRWVGDGLREEISLTNFGLSGVAVTLTLACDVDFADLFEVKEHRVEHRGYHGFDAWDDALVFRFRHEGVTRAVTAMAGGGPTIGRGMFRWHVELGPGETWSTCVQVSVQLGEQQIEPRFRCGQRDDDARPVTRLAAWRAKLPTLVTEDDELALTLQRTNQDLGALRIFDPEHPETPIVAAGAPWFMTLFGRDSLLAATMTLVADAGLARGVLETLARFQGVGHDPVTEEEPGKILHEMRFSTSVGLTLGGGQIYYGSIDATPLFVVLLGELARWTADDGFVRGMLPHADRAMTWIEECGDLDGDGFVEYRRRSDHGLANQGWKDSWDAVRTESGDLATEPIALCEVQGYVYAAHRARARLARRYGDAALALRHDAAADRLRERFAERFWCPGSRRIALALDGDKRPVDVAASNAGHCLWAGIVADGHAPDVAEMLLSPAMFSGWGIRTLARGMPAFNPVSYHNGSVWPHDNAICAAGLRRYGFAEHAQRVIRAQLDVAAHFEGRLPELFAGFDRSELSVPVSYPTSCSPQAWAAASPWSWVSTLLGLTHDDDDVLSADPHLPPWLSSLSLRDVDHRRGRIDVTAPSR